MSVSLPPPMFIAGTLGLDFLNSIATPVDEVVEWIGNGNDFLEWLRQAGLLTATDVLAVRTCMSPVELDAAAAQARSLREWLRGFVRKHHGKPLKPHSLVELGPLLELLERDEVFWTLTANPKSSSPAADDEGDAQVFQLQPKRRWRSPGALLLPIAEQIAKFVAAADFGYVKACEGKSCTLFFLDETRRHARRWCSMAACGNRAKQAAHRKRTEDDQD